MYEIFCYYIDHNYEQPFFLQESLCVLNINNNNIDEIRDLAVLKELKYLSAADNKLHDMEVNNKKSIKYSDTSQLL